MTSKLSSLSVFFPCYHDAVSIQKMVTEAFKLLPELTADFEVIVVDDGSADNTPAVLRSLEIKYPALKVVFHARNQGYGAALRTGFQTAAKDFIFYTDGDGQYSLNDLHLLVNLMDDHTDWVNGYKRNRQDPWYRKVLGGCYNQLIRYLFHIKLKDIDCDFRLFRRSLILQIPLRASSGSICVEMVKGAEQFGARIKECPVSHYPRGSGTSQFFNFRHLWNTFCEIVRLRRSLSCEKR